MKVYFTSAQTISPQDTFLKTEFPETISEFSEPLRNKPINFKEYFSPLKSRRINRLIKTAHVCAIEAINQARIEKPEAIITASGIGCVESTEKFLNDMLNSNEGLLAPTAFIQSTSNAIGGHIALHYNCQGYNVLYAQKSLSFETAIHDTFLRLLDKTEENILLGGFDELTDENCKLKQDIGIFKTGNLTNTSFLDIATKGSIPGEACSFFNLSTNPQKKALAELIGIKIDHQEKDTQATKNWIADFLSEKNMNYNDIDLVLMGHNGDKTTNDVYNNISDSCFSNSNIAYFKNFCGEYDTSSAFGTWFAIKALETKVIPEYSTIHNRKRKINNVLLYNQQQSKYHSLILMKSVSE